MQNAMVFKKCSINGICYDCKEPMSVPKVGFCPKVILIMNFPLYLSLNLCVKHFFSTYAKYSQLF